MTLAIKAVIQAEETARALSFDIDLGEAAVTEARAALLDSFTPEKLQKQVQASAVRIGKELARKVPSLEGAALSWIDQFNKGKFVVEVDTKGLERSIASVSDIGRQATVGVIVVGQLIGTAIVMAVLLQPELEQFQSIAYIAMIAFAITLIVSFVVLFRVFFAPTRRDDGSSPPQCDRERGARSSRLAGGLRRRSGLVVGEEPIEAAPRLGQDRAGRGLGSRRADAIDLDRRDPELAGEPAEIVARLAAGPRAVGRDGLRGGPAGVGQRERPASVAVLDRDEAFVLELLEGRVDRSGARAPAAAAALAELLHDLVAVHRLFGEESEGRFADRAAARVESAPAVTVRVRTAMSARLRPGASSRPAKPRGRRVPGVSIEMEWSPRLRRRLMGVWSVPSGAATGWFEVHSILSYGWLVLDCAITIYRVMPVVKSQIARKPRA